MAEERPLSEVLSCGCRLVRRGDFAHLYPCSEGHRTTARMTRQANSHVIVHEVAAR